MQSLGFAKIFLNEGGQTILMSFFFAMVWAIFYQTSNLYHRLILCEDRNISVSHFSWFHGLSRLVNDGPPRIESDHQTVNHWRSDGRLRILHFLQHCMRTAELTWTCSSTPLWLSPPHSWFWRGQHCSHAPPLRWVVTGASVTMASVGTHCPPAAGTGQTYPAQTLHTYRNYAIWMRHIWAGVVRDYICEQQVAVTSYLQELYIYHQLVSIYHSTGWGSIIFQAEISLHRILLVVITMDFVILYYRRSGVKIPSRALVQYPKMS